MRNVTIIFTQHTESGKCNSKELFEILQMFTPDVIFDEIPLLYFDAFYISKTRRTLESDAVNEFSKWNVVEIVPIDVDTSQELLRYQHQVLSMFSAFFRNQDYVKLDIEKENMAKSKGFEYLNGPDFLRYLEKKELSERQIIASSTNREELKSLYDLFRSINHDTREEAMLRNIYSYSRDNQFNKAVFLIGAEHRRSIMDRIKTSQESSSLQLNWKLYGET